ncbi:MAG TPA: hypothetical protein VIU61_20970, partial [Kofleriaceae bacterium]
MRLPILASLLVAAACGGGSDTPSVDAPSTVSHGFDKPTAALKANNETSPDVWVELGPANLGCLGTAANDPATTLVVNLTSKVRDFQSGAAVPGAVVTAFPNQSTTTPFPNAPWTADGNADVTIMIPQGTKRFGYKMTDADSLDTLLLNQTVQP